MTDTIAATDRAHAAGQSAAYSAVADMIAAGFPITEAALRAAAAAVAAQHTTGIASTPKGTATETGTPAWLEELLDSITTTQRETYRALGCHRVSVQVLAERLSVSSAAAGARVGALVDLGLAVRTGHGVYRAIRK